MGVNEELNRNSSTGYQMGPCPTYQLSLTFTLLKFSQMAADGRKVSIDHTIKQRQSRLSQLSKKLQNRWPEIGDNINIYI